MGWLKGIVNISIMPYNVWFLRVIFSTNVVLRGRKVHQEQLEGKVLLFKKFEGPLDLSKVDFLKHSER